MEKLKIGKLRLTIIDMLDSFDNLDDYLSIKKSSGQCGVCYLSENIYTLPCSGTESEHSICGYCIKEMLSGTHITCSYCKQTKNLLKK